MSRPQAKDRSAFTAFIPVSTRWMDNDVYGHVNNVVYYALFDTAVNRYLIEAGVLDINNSAVIGLVVETGCQYFSSVAFPDELVAGIKVAHIGNSSVRYEIGIFRAQQETCAAHGHFVHVYVDRATRRPVSLPEPLRKALEAIS